jgi:hypothetical protein
MRGCFDLRSLWLGKSERGQSVAHADGCGDCNSDSVGDSDCQPQPNVDADSHADPN